MTNEDTHHVNPPDWAGALLLAHEARDKLIEIHGAPEAAIEDMAFKLKKLPPWIRLVDFMEVNKAADLGYSDPLEMIRILAETCREREHIGGYPIQVVFWTGKKTKDQCIVRGKAGPMPARERLLWPGEGESPMWRVQLSLPYWLLADEMARYRLLHHELGHCDLEEDEEGNVKPILVGHDVEEFVHTAMRFGMYNPLLARLAAAVNGHPTSKKRAEGWGVDLTGEQLSLFAWPPADANVNVST